MERDHRFATHPEGLPLGSMYERLLAPKQMALHEQKTTYHGNERSLQPIWLKQIGSTLSTVCEQNVEVVSPGRWNKGKGPDFLDASLRINQKLYRGDIELHTSPEDWTRHGHQNDPAYEDVILHVFFEKRTTFPSCYTEAGRPILSCVLPKPEKLPVIPASSSCGDCAEEIFQHLSENELLFFLKEAAAWRFKQKGERLLDRYDEPNIACLGGIAEMLGAPNNQSSFSQLFLHLLPKRNLPFDRLFSHALRLLGFFDAKYQEAWSASPYYLKLLSFPILSPAPRLSFSEGGVRPTRHPVRTIAFFLRLMKSMEGPNLFNRFSEHQEGNLLSFFPEIEDPFWNDHYTFTSETKKKIRWLGPHQRLVLLQNVVFPLLFVTGSPEDQHRQLETFANLPSPKSTKKERLENRFLGKRMNKKLIHTALGEQAFFQLHRDFCSKFEISCNGCPFIELYKTNFKQSEEELCKKSETEISCKHFRKIDEKQTRKEFSILAL